LQQTKPWHGRKITKEDVSNEQQSRLTINTGSLVAQAEAEEAEAEAQHFMVM